MPELDKDFLMAIGFTWGMTCVVILGYFIQKLKYGRTINNFIESGGVDDDDAFLDGFPDEEEGEDDY